MIVPADVAARLDEMTDDEVRAAYRAFGLPDGYADAVLPSLRGERGDADLPLI